MTISTQDSKLLSALLELARAGTPATAIRLARHLDRTPASVREDLLRLDRAGLCDAERVRLSFVGLAVAAASASAVAAPARRLARAA